METILLQAVNSQMVVIHQALISSKCSPNDIVAYLDANLGESNWDFYTAPGLEEAQ